MSNENQATELSEAISILERAVTLGQTTQLGLMSDEDRARHLEVLADCERRLGKLRAIQKQITNPPTSN